MIPPDWRTKFYCFTEVSFGGAWNEVSGKGVVAWEEMHYAWATGRCPSRDGGRRSVEWAVFSVSWGFSDFSQLWTPQVSEGGGFGGWPFQHVPLFASALTP